MRRVQPLRLCLPILLSCLVLVACASTPPEQVEAQRVCANLQADTDACRQAFVNGYRDQAAAMRDGQPFTLDQLLSHVPASAEQGVSAGYVAGARYAETAT